MKGRDDSDPASGAFIREARRRVSPWTLALAMVAGGWPAGSCQGQAGPGRYPVDGLVGYWSFDEGVGATAADHSANKLDGRLEGPRWVEGRHGRALRFDGDDSVEVEGSPALQITGDITIAAWVRKGRPNEGKRWDAIVSKTPGKWDYELLTSKSRSDELAFYSKPCQPSEVYSGKPIPSGTWRHVAVTRAGSALKMYLDGELAGATTMSGTFPVNEGALQIGQDGPKRQNGMIGEIDEVFLYQRALTEVEIETIMR